MGGEETSCRVGYIFFTMQIVPNVLVWQNDDATFNGWGRDENWKGWIDLNEDGKIQSEELTNGIAPGRVHAHRATFVAAELRQEKESLEITGLPTGLFRFWEWGRLKHKFNPDWLLPLLPFQGLTLY